MSQVNLALLAPLILIQVVLLLVALYDLARRERVRGGKKWVWALVIIFGEILGPVAYFTFGRVEA